jgi:hypothetical protein
MSMPVRRIRCLSVILALSATGASNAYAFCGPGTIYDGSDCRTYENLFGGLWSLMEGSQDQALAQPLLSGESLQGGGSADDLLYDLTCEPNTGPVTGEVGLALARLIANPECQALISTPEFSAIALLDEFQRRGKICTATRQTKSAYADCNGVGHVAQITLYPAYFKESERERVLTILHEIAHATGKLDYFHRVLDASGNPVYGSGSYGQSGFEEDVKDKCDLLTIDGRPPGV